MPRLLMSPQTPDGWKLEELCDQLIAELHEKCFKISADARPAARQVLRNNQQIVGLLHQARALQSSNMDLLAQVGPNQGPLGTPRIGVGSSGYQDVPDKVDYGPGG